MNILHSYKQEDYTEAQFYEEFERLWRLMCNKVYNAPYDAVEQQIQAVSAWKDTKYTPIEYLKHFLDPKRFSNQIAVVAKQKLREQAWDHFVESCQVKRNTIVKIGCVGMFQCYLNISVKEAIERAKASGRWFDDFEHFIIEEFSILDEFGSYDCYSEGRGQRYNQNGELLHD